MFVFITSDEWNGLKKSIASLGDKIDYLHRMVSRNFTIVEQKEDKLMSAIDDLQTAVTAEDTVIDSAVTLIRGFAAQLAAAGTDPAKLAALQSDITAKTQALAAAVAANTPAAPPAPTPAPAPQAGRK